MKNNPFVHALVAALYISIVAFAMNTLTSLHLNNQTVFIPMFILSLFVLSAAIMGYLFLYIPLRLYFEDHKKESLVFFTKTVGWFACFVTLFLLLLLFSTQ